MYGAHPLTGNKKNGTLDENFPEVHECLSAQPNECLSAQPNELKTIISRPVQLQLTIAVAGGKPSVAKRPGRGDVTVCHLVKYSPLATYQTDFPGIQYFGFHTISSIWDRGKQRQIQE